MTNSSAAPHFDLTPPREAQLRRLIDDLSDEERRVMLHHGDEEPFCGVFLAEKREGVFTCRLFGLPLSKAGTKFESGTGWPSFTRRSMKITCAACATPAARRRRLRSCAPAVARSRGTSLPTEASLQQSHGQVRSRHRTAARTWRGSLRLRKLRGMPQGNWREVIYSGPFAIKTPREERQ